MFQMQIGASGSLSFDDVVTDDGIVTIAQPVSHLAAIQQTEEVAIEEAKNFTVNCKCCNKSSDQVLFFFHKVILACHSFVCILGYRQLLCMFLFYLCDRKSGTSADV